MSITALEPNLPPRAPIDLGIVWQSAWVLRFTTVAGKSAQRQKRYADTTFLIHRIGLSVNPTLRIPAKVITCFGPL